MSIHHAGTVDLAGAQGAGDGGDDGKMDLGKGVCARGRGPVPLLNMIPRYQGSQAGHSLIIVQVSFHFSSLIALIAQRLAQCTPHANLYTSCHHLIASSRLSNAHVQDWLKSSSSCRRRTSGSSPGLWPPERRGSGRGRRRACCWG